MHSVPVRALNVSKPGGKELYENCWLHGGKKTISRQSLLGILPRCSTASLSAGTASQGSLLTEFLSLVSPWDCGLLGEEVMCLTFPLGLCEIRTFPQINTGPFPSQDRDRDARQVKIAGVHYINAQSVIATPDWLWIWHLGNSACWVTHHCRGQHKTERASFVFIWERGSQVKS